MEVKFLGLEPFQKKYQVEIINDGNGTVEVDKMEVIENEKLTITIIPKDGYELKELNIDDKGNGKAVDFSSKVKNGKVTITCGKNDIKIEAIFKLIKEQPKEKKIIYVWPEPGTEGKGYIGREQELIILGFDPQIMTISGNKAKERGEYKAIISVKDAENYALSYNGIVASTIEIEWTISINWLTPPIISQREYEYTGKEIELKIDGIYGNEVSISGNKATEVGEYEATFSIKDTENYKWIMDSANSTLKEHWKIVNSNLNENDSQNSSAGDSSEDETTIKELKKYTTRIIQSKGGNIETDSIEVEEGENQIFTIIPEKGYKIVDVKVDNKSIGAVSRYTLKNVRKTHTITAEFEKIIQEDVDLNQIDLENQYEDINLEEWYYDSIKYVIAKGLFKGVSDHEFAPNVTMNRAMLVTVLYRLGGEKDTDYKNKFEDVEKGAYYENAVNWATENEIVSGINENEFAPFNKITREQLVVMLYRFAKLNGKNVNQRADLSSYEDFNEISDYAKEATAWAVKSGYINGRSETILALKDTATRAEVATILMRFSEI